MCIKTNFHTDADIPIFFKRFFDMYFEICPPIEGKQKDLLKLKDIYKKISENDGFAEINYTFRLRKLGQNAFYKWLSENGVIVGGNTKGFLAKNIVAKSV